MCKEVGDMDRLTSGACKPVQAANQRGHPVGGVWIARHGPLYRFCNDPLEETPAEKDRRNATHEFQKHVH